MAKKLKWMPENNMAFYYIGRKLRVESDWYTVGHNEYIESGNCFETSEEAEQVLLKILPLFNDKFEGEDEPTDDTNDLILLEGEEQA